MRNKPQFLEEFSPPSFGKVAKAAFVIFLESMMAVMFYSIYSETVTFMSQTYLSELPIVGLAFENIAPDANTSHLISGLLAVFSVSVPIVIWSYILENNILNNFQEFFSYPQNRIVAVLALIILLLVIVLECTSMYTLIARGHSATGSGFITTEQTGVMLWLAENKGMAIGVSIVIAVINITLALFTTLTFRTFKHQEKTV